MKKIMLITTLLTGLTACSSGYHRDIASINAERNTVQAQVTSSSLEQQRMQRQNQLEESILRRQQDAMATQSKKDIISIIGTTLENTIGTILK